MNDLIPSPPPPGGEFLFYGSDDGRIRLQVRLEDETVWLTEIPPSRTRRAVAGGERF